MVALALIAQLITSSFASIVYYNSKNHYLVISGPHLCAFDGISFSSDIELTSYEKLINFCRQNEISMDDAIKHNLIAVNEIQANSEEDAANYYAQIIANGSDRLAGDIKNAIRPPLIYAVNLDSDLERKSYSTEAGLHDLMDEFIVEIMGVSRDQLKEMF